MNVSHSVKVRSAKTIVVAFSNGNPVLEYWIVGSIRTRKTIRDSIDRKRSLKTYVTPRRIIETQ